MSALASSPSRVVLRISLAGVKWAKGRLRSAGVGDVHPEWQARAEACQRCPLVVVDRCGRSYCGRPFLRKVDRDEPTEGCGCPVLAKARDPREHCPRDARFNAPARDEHGNCSCVWCGGSH